MAITVADLVARLTLDDQMSPALNKAGQTIENQSRVADGTFRNAGGYLAAAGAALAAPLIGATKLGIDFERQLANVNSIAHMSQDALAGIGDELIEMSARVNKGPAELAASMYDVVSSGFAEADALKIVEAGAKAANAGLTDASTATGAITSVLNAYKRPAEDAANISDVLFRTVEKGVITFPELANSLGSMLPAASALGVPLEEVGAAYAKLTLNGVNAAETETQVAALMRAAINPTEDLANAVADAGYESAEAMVQAEGLGGFLKFLDKTASGSSEALFDLTGETRAFRAAQALTGAGLADYIAFLNEMNGASEGAGATQAALNEQMQSAGYQLDRAGVAAQTAGTQFGSDFAPAVEWAAEKVGDLLFGVADMKPEARKAIGATAALGAGLSTVGGAALFAIPHLREMKQTFTGLKSAPGIIGGIARGAGLLLRMAGPVGLLASAGLAAYGTNFLGFADLVDRGAARIQEALPATQAALADFADEVQTRGGALIDAVRAGDWQGASDIVADAIADGSTWAQEQLNRAGSLFEGLDLSGLLTLDDVSLANIAAKGGEIGRGIGAALVGGLQSAGGLKDYIVTELPGQLGGAKDALTEAMQGIWTDMTSPVNSMGGPGERGESFGSAASITNGAAAFFTTVIRGIRSEFERAFASGALPTPSSDFIVKPIQQMLENAKTGIVGAFDGFRHFLGEQIRNLLEVLDQIPGVDMSADIAAMNDALALLETAKFGISERDAALAAEVVTGAGLGNYDPTAPGGLVRYLTDEERAVEATLFGMASGYDDLEASRAAINDIVGKPLTPQGPSLAEQAGDFLLPESGYFEGKAQGAEATGTAALIAEQNMIQEQLATLGAEYAETQAAAETQMQANAAARAVYNNLVSSGGWGDAGNASAAATLPRRIQEPAAPAADPLVTALPQVGGDGAVGSADQAAAQVQSQLAEAQQALTSGLAQLRAATTSGIQGIVTAFQTGMATAAAAAASGAAAILAPLQALPQQIAAVAGSAAAAAGSIGDAIVQELQADVGAVQAAAQELAAAAEVGIDAAIQPGSPSRMAIPYGQSIGEGLVYGMEQTSPEVLAAAGLLGYSAEQGLSPLLDSVSASGQAAAKALGVDLEQALAESVVKMPVWEPKDQIDPMWLPTFDKAATVLTRYGKRAGDDAATKAGEAFAGLAGAIGDVLGGSAQYLNEEAAKAALKGYRRLDAEAKAKLPDGTKEALKAAFDEANVTIGDVIQQRMGGRLGEMGGIGARFKSQRDTILRAMMGQRTIEQKAQAAAEDGLGLVIDAFKNGLMSAAPSAEGAAESAMQSALGGIGGPGEAMKGGMLASMFGGGTGGDAEEFAWALCECMSGANREMLGELGLGNTAENGVAMLGHDLENAIAGTGNDFRQQMLDYANANPALNKQTSWLDDSASCVSICDQAASEMGDAAGQAAGQAAGAAMPAMPKAADIGGAAGSALGEQMGAQCVNLCGGSLDSLAGGVSEGIKGASLGEMAVKEVSADISTGGARELGKQLRGALGAPSAALPGDTPLSADGLAEQVSGGLTQDCITLCDDAGMSDAAGAMGSAAQDMGGAINSLVNSMIGSKFQETLSGIQQGLQGMSGGSGETPGLPSGVEVPDLIHKLNPNINRALNFDLASTNPHAAGLLGFGPLGGGGSTPIHLNVTMEMDGQAVGSAVAKGMIGPLQQAAGNRRSGAGLTVRR